jgi:hypothetical protein
MRKSRFEDVARSGFLDLKKSRDQGDQDQVEIRKSNLPYYYT